MARSLIREPRDRRYHTYPRYRTYLGTYLTYLT